MAEDGTASASLQLSRRLHSAVVTVTVTVTVNDTVYGAVIVTLPLREFTEFI